MIIINIQLLKMKRPFLILFITFISFYAASDDAVSENVEIGAYSVIGHQVTIDSGTRLHSHVNIMGNTKIGSGNEIFPFTSIGNDPQDLKYQGEENSLIIGNDNKKNLYISRVNLSLFFRFEMNCFGLGKSKLKANSEIMKAKKKMSPLYLVNMLNPNIIPLNKI